MSQGARLDATDDQGNTPLHLAVLSQSVRVVKDLLLKGADRKAQNLGNKTASDLV